MQTREWSEADARGIRTCALDVGARVTLRGRRLRCAERLDLDACAHWPQAWRDLARDWLAGSQTPQLRTLLATAGARRAADVADLLDAMLAAGWIEADERREDGRWRTFRVRFTVFEDLRERLGLPHRDKQAEQQRQTLAARFSHAALDAAAIALGEQAPEVAIRRHGWLTRLAAWLAEGRRGTRRDFALFASGHTKGIANADWEWMARHLVLAEFGIEAHTPLLLLRAPIVLASVPDFAGLTPATIAAGGGLEAVGGGVLRWRLVENRTSFERAARRYGEQEAVIWLPGYPPHWWREAVWQLLRRHPAPALIACDPDPAGVEIALIAGGIWEAAGLAWEPLRMDAAVLDALPATQPLAEADRALLARLRDRPMPATLRDLCAALAARGIKGEQEGLADAP